MPWSLIFTALLLPLFFGGCRKPAPPVRAWVRLDALTPLHPEQAMIADLDHRIHALRAQHGRFPQTGASALPPLAVEQATPALPAPEEPEASPQLDRHTDQFVAQRLESYAQLLDRDRQKKIDSARLKQIPDIAARHAQVEKELAADAEAQRKQLEQEYYLVLLNAKMELATRQARAKDGTAASASRLAKAQAEYAAVHGEYQQRLEEVRARYRQLTRARQAGIEQEYAEKLKAYDRQLAAENMQLLGRKQQALLAEAEHDVESPPVPPLQVSAIPAGKLLLDVPGLDDAFRQSDAARGRGRQTALGDIDRVIAELERERQRLQARIRQDTLQAVTALAARHGYRITADASEGADLTAQSRAWLAEYWQP